MKLTEQTRRDFADKLTKLTLEFHLVLSPAVEEEISLHDRTGCRHCKLGDHYEIDERGYLWWVNHKGEVP
mgnify:CR=1 FL=1